LEEANLPKSEQRIDMASTTTNGVTNSSTVDSGASSASRPLRRTISPEAARALKILGHAIEYLANEFLHDDAPPGHDNPRLQAVRLLMALNRQTYFECPMEPVALSFRERCREIFRTRHV
jgi:hypothetical protein